MAVVANVRVSLSPRSTTGTRQAEQPDVVRPARRRPTYTDGRRPARLAGASVRPATQQCAPRPVLYHGEDTALLCKANHRLCDAKYRLCIANSIHM